MNQKSHCSLIVWISLLLCAAIPANAAPKSTPAGSPSASPAASAEAKAHPFPLTSVIVSVDKGTHTLTVGKKTAHKVYVKPETKLTQEDKPVAFETLVAGMEVRCSVTKRTDKDYDAASIKIGPKATPSPAPANPQ